jgi:hypothetical protein
MNVPLRLKRKFAPDREADAFLLRAADFTPLAHAIRTLPQVQVHPVAGGFLLLPSGPTSADVNGAIRLRRLGGDLYVPHDAVLLPSLLPDEIAGLTRDRGLVVLPDRSVLEFDSRQSLPVSRWLACRVERSTWEPLPPAPALADELRSIEHPTPPAAVIEILASGEPDGADPMPTEGSPRESDRPATGSTLGSIGASMGMAAGGLLAWLGRNLGMPGLAKAGANLARKAIEAVPRLSEKLFGEQEAALRDVLRELQEGDPEKALRRAPPAVGDPDAPTRFDMSSSLGTRDPRWSLGTLIGGGSVQAGWLGGGDIWAKLAEEYRRLAREAVARGDFRRAAYLHGVLLRDFRAAANALLAGGLHRDAAILLRDKVKDEPAAATAFEQAGDFDEALRLYDRCGFHEAAGDLLMRLGDRVRAHERFILVADAHARRGHWHAAGDLIWRKVADRETACAYFRCGWNQDEADSLACGRRLFAEHVEAEDWPRTRELFDQAESRFVPPRSSDARGFFHAILKSTRVKLPEELQDEFTDRMRLQFATHLRPAKEQGRGGALARDLFPVEAGWMPAVGRDAAFAAGSRKKPDAEIPVPPPVEVAKGTVRAVSFFGKTRCVAIATDEALTYWSQSQGGVRICGLEGKSVLGLATDPYAKCVFMLVREYDAIRLACHTEHRGTWTHACQFEFREPAGGAWHIEPLVLRRGSEHHVTVATPERREMFVGTQLLPRVPIGYQVNGSHTHLLAATEEHFWDWDDRFIRCLESSGKVLLRWVPHWTPAVPAGSSLAIPPLDWLSTENGSIEIAGVDADGIVHYSRFSLKEGGTRSFDTDGERWRFRAACFVSPGSVIGVTDDNRLVWIRPRMIVELKIADDVLRSSPARIVALHKTGLSREFTVVFEDGRVAVIRDWS